jgi:hypothetical protein
LTGKAPAVTAVPPVTERDLKKLMPEAGVASAAAKTLLFSKVSRAIKPASAHESFRESDSRRTLMSKSPICARCVKKNESPAPPIVPEPATE